MRKRIHRPSPALVVASLALFVAIGGTGYAAATINGKDIQNGTVTAKKLKNKTVTGGKVKKNTLTGAQINESKLGRVPAATRANSAANADAAATAATAGIANSIANDTVTSSKVVKGSLTGADVGRKAGTTTVSIGDVNANACNEYLAEVDPTNSIDLRNDAFALTVEDTWPSGLTVFTENSNSMGYVRLNVCNQTGAEIPAGNQVIHWVAFAV